MQKKEKRILCGNIRILEYVFIRKAVKNINMRIRLSGEIVVSAPSYISVKHVDEFVLSKEREIIKALDEYREIREKAPRPPEYISGETIGYLGEKLLLMVVEDKKESVEKQGTQLLLKVKDASDYARKEKLIQKWFHKKTEEVFVEICEETYPLFEPYGVSYPKIRIRFMKSRWGSCQPVKGVITLNSKMIEAPKEAIEYVVLHEFAHFIHPNHSKDFYAFVESFMPDWKQRKAMLRELS